MEKGKQKIEFTFYTSLTQAQLEEILQSYKTKAKLPTKYNLMKFVDKKAGDKVTYPNEKCFKSAEGII